MANKEPAFTGQSLGIRSASKPSIYGTYLCPEPGFIETSSGESGYDDTENLVNALRSSTDYFFRREQMHAVERIQFQIAREHMRGRYWKDAIDCLIPLWQNSSWRQTGWWHLLEEVDLAIRECARLLGDGETLIAVEWELLNSLFTPRPNWQYDLSRCLDGVELLKPRPQAVVRAENVLSCVSAAFTFGAVEGHVGEALSSQLVISSLAHQGSVPIKISHIKIAFAGGLKDLEIHHDAIKDPVVTTADRNVQLYQITFHSASSISSTSVQSLLGSSDLTVFPNCTKALSLITLPREAGDVSIISITLCVDADLFHLDFVTSREDQICSDDLWIRSTAGLSKKSLGKGRSNVFTILPKPPKMRIELPNLSKIHFTDEHVAIDIRLVNEEEEDATLTLDVRLLGRSGTTPELSWGSLVKIPEDKKESSKNGTHTGKSSHLYTDSLGQLVCNETQNLSVVFQANPEPAEYVLEIVALYHLSSELGTTISKTSVTDLVFLRPFEATYDMFPQIHTEPWPSYFRVDDVGDGEDNAVASGLCQSWSLIARTTSSTAGTLAIESVELRVLGVHSGAVCLVSKVGGPDSGPSLLSANELRESQFHLTTQKLDLEDRRLTTLELQLEIKWRRENPNSLPSISFLAVPQLAVPFGEPRVLASVQNGQSDTGLFHLDYAIENPSMHLLTFNLTMESSEEFVFSGPKSTSLQLVPLSRHTVRYTLLPSVRGAWISPRLSVVDVYFKKTLKIHATQGMRSDKKGILIWSDAEG